MNPAIAPRTPDPSDAEPPARSCVPTREHHRSLRSKLVLGVAVILCALFVLHEMIRKRIIRDEFATLEQFESIRDVRRVVAAIRSDVGHHAELVGHLGTDFGDATAGKPFPSGTGDWAITAGPQGDVRWIRRAGDGPGNDNSGDDGSGNDNSGDDRSRDDEGLREEEGKEVNDSRVRELVAEILRHPEERCSGMAVGPNDSLVMFAAVRTGVASGRDRGSGSPTREDLGEETRGSGEGQLLVCGRTLDESRVDELRDRTGVPFLIDRALEDSWPPDGGVKAISFRGDDDHPTHVERSLLGLDSQPIAQLVLEVPREISERALHANATVRNYFLFGSVAALFSLLWMLQRIVVAPIVAIREHTERIAERGLETERLVIPVNDEIGELAKAFDRMTGRLSEAQRRLSETSRAAGARQVADSVIHNIGNVLTNVNSLLDAANAEAAGLRVCPLQRLADRLETSVDDREFLEATPAYLRSLADSLGRDQKSLGDLLGTLGGNLRHIHDVIRAQRRHASQGLESETLTVGDLVREAIDCCRAKLERDEISVNLAGALHETLRTDRSLLLQVFINVVGNAGEALRGKEPGARSLRIELTSGDGVIQISFRDNGVGMDGETLRRAFDAHFTTRPLGSGLGLHFCALAVSRLGGGMRAMSDGPGRGATFVIDLPRVTPAEAACMSGTPHTPSRTTAEAGS